MELVTEVWPLLRFTLWATVAILLALAVKGPGADAVRWSGGFLQLFGLSTVAIEIGQLRGKFKLPKLSEVLRRWRQMCLAVFLPRRHVLAAGSGHFSVGASGFGRGRVTMAPGAPLHKRISLLEQQVSSIEDRLDTTDQELAAEAERLRSELSSRFAAQHAELEQAASQLKDVAVGGNALALTGWAWLLLGVIAATFPGEIANLLGRIG